MLSKIILSLVLFVVALPAAQVAPDWIWTAKPADKDVRFFRKSVELAAAPDKATLLVACDNGAVVFVNGTQVAQNAEWSEPTSADVTKQLKPGENIIAVRADNQGSAAGLLVKLDINGPGEKKTTVVTDTSWLVSGTGPQGWQTTAFKPDARWAAAASQGKLGTTPWGNVLEGGGRSSAGKARTAPPAEAVTVLDGFKLELLHDAQPGEGSWVAMTIDPQGRLIISPQGKEAMLRVTLDVSGKVANIEKLNLPVSGAMGLLYAFDSLYVNGGGPQGYHLYRLPDTDKQGNYGPAELIRKWKGGPGEHGAHGIVLGQDKKLYVVCGNFVDVPDDVLPTSPYRNYADDQVLPRMEDGNNFGAGRKPPGGYVVRIDPDGKNAELFASGQRNTYDIAFNPDGELFGFDSDMEWDWGSPWYRPTRIHHVVSGADHGFREGTAKWPEHYQDSLPPVVNIGIGSPTGVRFGTGAKSFPPKYQRALYAMDWSYGRIVAVHLQPQGAGYTATFEHLLRGKPFNVTDLEIGRDGAMYLTIGGRGTHSALYRVSYVGPQVKEELAIDQAAVAARALRHQLEAFHGRQDAKALDTAWPHLNSDDRYTRYAARIAVESQPVAQWRQRALDEREVNASLTALLALSRCGAKEDQDGIITSLGKLEGKELSDTQVLEALRVLEVSMARMGKPGDADAAKIIEKLDPAYPNEKWLMNRELSQILIALNAPGVVKRTLDLAAKAGTQEEQLHYIVALRLAKSGWTVEDWKRCLSWFQTGADAGGTDSIPRSAKHPATFEQWFADVGNKPGNGASYGNFIKKLKADIVGKIPEAERAQLASLITDKPAAVVKPAAPRKFVRDWKMADFADDMAKPSRARSYARGKEAYTAAQCVLCHRFNDEGGAVGPDLSGASAKYSKRDLLESILEPSKVLSDQFQNIIVTTKDGEDTVGRIVEENDKVLVLVPNPLTGDRVEIKKSNVKERAASKLSPMAEGLVSILTREEILDLLAYLESAGRKEHAAFGK